MGTMHRHPENFVEQAMVHDHPDEGTGGEQGIDAAKGPLCDPRLDVSGQVIVEHPVVFIEEHFGEFMAFQRAEEKQAQEGRVRSWPDPEAGN